VRVALRLLIVIVFCLPLLAAPVELVVRDNAGKPIAKALIILQDLDHRERAFSRTLTDGGGEATVPSLQPGQYRVITITTSFTHSPRPACRQSAR
jgi:hypothetical protein